MSDAKLPKYKELPMGGLITEAGNAVEYETGGWRTFKPVFHKDKCINCLSCWVHCPDSSIIIEDEKVTGIEYKHCKGCGICAEVCPPKATAIIMVKE
jgi:pyruvate ferredoxin oxidoreductase delta subunit